MNKKIKGLLYFLFAAFIFTACKKDPVLTKPQPVISITSEGGVAITGDTIRMLLTKDTAINLKYNIDATGQIKWLYQTLNGAETQLTDAEGKATYDKMINFVLPAETKNYELLVKVTNTLGGRSTRRIIVAVKKYVPPVAGFGGIKTFTGLIAGGPNSVLYYSRYDLDEGVPRGDVSNPSVKATVDIDYREKAFSDRFGSTTFPNGIGCTLGTTTLDATSFGSIQYASEMDSETGVLNKVDIEVGKVYVCITPEGKKALILITAYDAGDDNITFDVKIQVDAPCKTFRDLIAGGPNSALYYSRYDLDEGVPRGDVSNPDIKATVDVDYREKGFSDRFGSGTFPNGIGCTLGYTTLNADDFNVIRTGKEMDIFTGTLSKIDIEVGGVYLCITPKGKKALILVKAYDASDDNITFDVKIQR